MLLSMFGFVTGMAVGFLLGFVFLVVAVLLLTKKLDVESATIPQKRSLKEEETEDVHRYVVHPNIMKKGRFASYVWIVSGDEWDITKPIHKFPPPDYGTGDSKGLVKYYAEIKDGMMTLSWTDAQKKNEIMKIELDGCSCRLVDECLGVKNVWWRKAPLEIGHPIRCLYRGCSRLLMFCLHGSDKEQWYVGLSMFMERGKDIKDIQRIYRRYSKNFRRKTSFRFPTRQPIVQNEEVVQNEKSAWFTSWRRGTNTKTSSTVNASSVPSKPIELAEEIEQLWNGGKSRLVFAEEHSKRSFKSQGRKNKARRHERNLSGSISNTNNKPLQSPKPPRTPQGRPIDSPESFTKTTDGSDGTCLTLGETSSRSTDTPVEASTSQSTSEQSSRTSMDEGVYGLNMFLARWSFDLARNPDFETKFRAFIVKKLAGLRRPSYVTPFTLQTLDMGSNFPEIRSIRSLPPRGTVICPELLVDLSYAGGLEITVETFVDLREGSIWDTVDRKLTQFQGTSEQRTEPTGPLSDVSEVGDLGEPSTVGEDEVGTPEEKTPNGFSVRKIAALMAKQFAERMAESISKIPLRLAVKVLKLEGTLLIWMSPPPAKRLWISFMRDPTMEITAKPILGNRIMKYSVALSRVSSWLQKKIKDSFFKNLVFPNCADLSFPSVLGLMDEHGLKHPISAVMHDLRYVSEYDSEEDISETPPASVPITPTELNTTAIVEDKSPESTVKNPTVHLPIDDRLTLIRHHRYDPHRLGTMRRNWIDMSLDNSIPSKHRHGRRIVKRCISFSDGDASPGNSEPEVMDDNDIASDCNEFFDADVSFHSIRSSSTEDDPSPKFEDVHGMPMATEQDDQEIINETYDRAPSCRRLSVRFGDLWRSVHNEDNETRRRRHGSFSGANNIMKVARQKAEEQRQKVKDVLETKTAQLRNAGFSRLWISRRPPDRNVEMQ